MRTLAAPAQVDDVAMTLDAMWWDRPYTVTGVDIGAGSATLHTVTSYGARQDIELRTNDADLVDKLAVTTEPPRISSWADVDAVLTKTGARYSYQLAKVDNGQCHRVAGTNIERIACRWLRFSSCTCSCRRRCSQGRHAELE